MRQASAVTQRFGGCLLRVCGHRQALAKAADRHYLVEAAGVEPGTAIGIGESRRGIAVARRGRVAPVKSPGERAPGILGRSLSSRPREDDDAYRGAVRLDD